MKEMERILIIRHLKQLGHTAIYTYKFLKEHKENAYAILFPGSINDYWTSKQKKERQGKWKQN